MSAGAEAVFSRNTVTSQVQIWLCNNSLGRSAQAEYRMILGVVEEGGSRVNFMWFELIGRGSPCFVVQISAAAGGRTAVESFGILNITL